MSKKNKKKQKDEVSEFQDGVCECGSEESCCCGGHSHHHQGCCCEEGFERQFYTRDEKIQMLEEYLADLKAEQKGVEEALEELRKAG
ncbi:MAG: hypothetical protein C0391_03195 [Anaerolinea sp.]|nr:hypothetical protein [Anaerolinea sp.]